MTRAGSIKLAFLLDVDDRYCRLWPTIYFKNIHTTMPDRAAATHHPYYV